MNTNMKTTRKNYCGLTLAILIASLWGRTAFSQNYLMDISVNLIPPYSIFISDWQTHPEKIQVQVINRDTTGWFEYNRNGVRSTTDHSYGPGRRKIRFNGYAEFTTAQFRIDILPTTNRVQEIYINPANPNGGPVI